MANTSNFCDTMWADGIETELEKQLVMAEDCVRKYEGAVKEMGDRVKIIGVGRPTIHHLTVDQANEDIEAPELINGSSMFLDIDQIAYFNVMIGNIEKAQSKNGIMDAFIEQGTYALSDDIDTFIGKQAVAEGVPLLYTEAQKITAKDTTTGSAKYVLDVIDLALEKLRENNVKGNTPLVLTVTPRFATVLRKAYNLLDTNNHEGMKNGYIGMYNGIKVKMSNNVAQSEDGLTDFIMLRTKTAIAYVNQLSEVEAYKPEKKLPGHAVKAVELYGAKVINNKQIITLNVKYA